MTRSAPREPGVEVGRLHHQLDAGPEGERLEPVLDRRAARTRRRRRRRRPGVSRSRRPVARLELVGPGRVPARRARRRPRASRPSAGRRPRPRRAARAAGWSTSQATSRSTAGAVGPVGRAHPVRTAQASSRPAPPSVVALPPMPSATWRAPASIAAPDQLAGPDRASPPIGSRSPRREPRQARRLGHLDDRARARRPSAASARRSAARADRGPSPSCHVQPPAAAIASSVPSPPSASGQSRIVSSGPGAAPSRRPAPCATCDRRQRALERVGRDAGPSAGAALTGGPSRRTSRARAVPSVSSA